MAIRALRGAIQVDAGQQAAKQSCGEEKKPGQH